MRPTHLEVMRSRTASATLMARATMARVGAATRLARNTARYWHKRGWGSREPDTADANRPYSTRESRSFGAAVWVSSPGTHRQWSSASSPVEDGVDTVPMLLVRRFGASRTNSVFKGGAR
jgi:hypothetical protein